jgi:hypothetical protein
VGCIWPKFLDSRSRSRNNLRNTSNNSSHSHKMAQSDEEDDYMNMVFEDAPKGPKYETSLQRAARKRKEVRLAATSRLTLLTTS